MSRRNAPDESPRQPCIAQIIGTFGGGGAQRRAYDLALGLVEERFRSVAIALRSKGNYGEGAIGASSASRSGRPPESRSVSSAHTSACAG